MSTSDEIGTPKQENAIMLHVGEDKNAWRCSCGANCFHYPNGDRRTIKCNGCHTEYLEGRDFER